MENSQTNIEESQVVAYLNGEALPEEVAQRIALWLESNENKQEARAIYQAWELSALANDNEVDAQLAFERFKDKVDLNPLAEEPRVVPISRWWYAAAAAMAVVLVSIWLLRPVDDTMRWQAELTTAEKVLGDESKVTLNAQSILSYSPSAIAESDKREVRLEGEAFFEVAPNPDKPFLVHTADVEVKVLGTKFMVKTYPDKPTQVIVSEGKVQVTYLKTGQILILEAKEEVAPELGEEPIVAESDQNQLYWKTGVLEFPENTLDQVFHTLEAEFSSESRWPTIHCSIVRSQSLLKSNRYLLLSK